METQPTAFIPKPLCVVVIGAGISGIQFVKDVTTRLANVEITVFDKNSDVGGTWFENRYPGCACDVPSHAYQYSWGPNPRWSQLYATAPEILSYLKATVNENNLRRHFRFNQRCVAATWDDGKSYWTVTLEHVHKIEPNIQVQCDVFIYAVGRLNNWKWPDIPGLDGYDRQKIHTACWPDNFSHRGKSIGIIGNGSSGLQCVAGLRKEVKSIRHFVRGPTWLVPHVFSDNEEPQVIYTKQEIEERAENSDIYYDFRIKLERKLAATFEGLWRGAASERFTRRAREHMERNIEDEDHANALIPSFPAGCRRFTPADLYMEALAQPNVELVSSPLVWADESALYTADGRRHELDCIICGTGFEPYKPLFPVTGRRGRSLSDKWSEDGGHESYLAASVAGFPNFFVFNPPICPVNGSAYPGIERASDYMIRVIHRLQTDNLKSVCVKDVAQAEFSRWAQSQMPHMVWSGACSSWYKLNNGKVVVPWPGTHLHYYAATELVRWEDYDLEFVDPLQKYASFGNGITVDGFHPDNVPWLKN